MHYSGHGSDEFFYGTDQFPTQRNYLHRSGSKTNRTIQPGSCCNDYEYTSGQIGIDPQTGALADTLEDQTHQVMKNLKAILAVSGLGFDDVIIVPDIRF